jgi:hypothetical protein
MNKISKADARYTDRSTSSEKCAGCKHFEVLAAHHCEAVEGIIKPGGWCRLWARLSRMARALRGK